MEISKIIPLFKSGEKSDPITFRPVSILSILSKIFEKIIYHQLLAYFNAKKLLYSHQYGFTKGQSTTDAAVWLVIHIIKAWEKSNDMIGVFCDLYKAFHCVDHKTLLIKF